MPPWRRCRGAAQQPERRKNASGGRGQGDLRQFDYPETDSGSEMAVTDSARPACCAWSPANRSEERSHDPVERCTGRRSHAGRRTASDDGKSVAATTAVVMKKADVAEKQQHDREAWQKNGVGGVVKAVDPPREQSRSRPGHWARQHARSPCFERHRLFAATLPIP